MSTDTADPRGPAGAPSPAETFIVAAQRLAAGLTGALAGAGPVARTSEGGSITVSLDADGVVAAIELTEAWDRECPYVEDLPRLILDTIGAAHADRFGQAMTNLADRDREGSRSPGPLVDRVEVPPRERRASLDAIADTIRAGGGLRAMVADVTASLTEAMSVTGEGRSRDGTATATANHDRRIIGLDLDPDWLEAASGADIGSAATEAVLAAIRAVPQVDVDEVIAGTAFGRLQAELRGPATASRGVET